MADGPVAATDEALRAAAEELLEAQDEHDFELAIAHSLEDGPDDAHTSPAEKQEAWKKVEASQKKVEDKKRQKQSLEKSLQAAKKAAENARNPSSKKNGKMDTFPIDINGWGGMCFSSCFSICSRTYLSSPHWLPPRCRHCLGEGLFHFILASSKTSASHPKPSSLHFLPGLLYGQSLSFHYPIHSILSRYIRTSQTDLLQPHIRIGRRMPPAPRRFKAFRGPLGTWAAQVMHSLPLLAAPSPRSFSATMVVDLRPPTTRDRMDLPRSTILVRVATRLRALTMRRRTSSTLRGK